MCALPNLLHYIALQSLIIVIVERPVHHCGNDLVDMLTVLEMAIHVLHFVLCKLLYIDPLPQKRGLAKK